MYFGFRLGEVRGKREALIKGVLGVSEESFLAGCSVILNKMWKTLFFFSKTQAQPGLGQTMYAYIYISRTHSRLLSMSDILTIKIFLLLLNKKYPLTFESLV